MWPELVRVVMAVLLLLHVPRATEAQASPLLPPDHWAVAALRRVEALGLVPEYLAAERSVPRRVAGEVLRGAATQAEAEGAAWAPLTAAWLARFEEEFPETREDPDSATGFRMLGSSVGAGYLRATGRRSPGLGEFPPTVTGPAPLPDLRDAWVGTELAVQLGSPLAASVVPSLGTDGLRLHRWEAGLSWRNWALVAGRGAVGYGFGEGGGVLLSGEGVLDRVEIVTARPFYLPGVLRHLGPVAFQTFLSVLPGDRHPGEPVFTGVRLSGRIHPRITLAGQRAAMIGGSELNVPLTLERLSKVLLSRGGVEDQIASVEVRLHLPTESVVPVTVHCEWGAEDTAGAFTQVPGILCGALLPAVPALPALAVGAEHAFFAARCCSNPPWYRHSQFPGSWALEETPLGHPLGGEGSEWLAFARGSLIDARLQLETRAFRRTRSGENLFVPGREGDSFGVGGEASWRFRRRSEVGFSAFRESGDGWSEARMAISTRILF